jgi:phospholipid transport system substrate-binding protein
MISTRSMTHRASALLLFTTALTVPSITVAQVSDPAAITVERFDHVLLDTMKQGKALGGQGRYRKLAPAVAQAHDLPLMTRFAVGPRWTALSPADQQNLVRAFTRFSVATYAHNFDSYEGQRFTVDPKVQTRGPDKLVRAQLVGSGSPVQLSYRMRQSAGQWKIIDVYFSGGISQLTAQRSDFSATLNAGGAAALVKKLNDRADSLLK